MSYIRWKDYRGKAGTTYRAELVESVLEGGKPRQHVLAYLGSIRESADPAERERFLAVAQARLAALPFPVSYRCIAALARRVHAAVPPSSLL